MINVQVSFEDPTLSVNFIDSNRVRENHDTMESMQDVRTHSMNKSSITNNKIQSASPDHDSLVDRPDHLNHSLDDTSQRSRRDLPNNNTRDAHNQMPTDNQMEGIPMVDKNQANGEGHQTMKQEQEKRRRSCSTPQAQSPTKRSKTSILVFRTT